MDSSLDMYADDSTLGVTEKTVEDIENKLNSDMKTVDTWCESNRMATNCDKTKVILITTYQKETKLDYTHIQVTCQNKELENVKLLCVIIDKNLTWKSHKYKTAKSISCNIVLLRKIKKYFPHQIRITFYKTTYNPI